MPPDTSGKCIVGVPVCSGMGATNFKFWVLRSSTIIRFRRVCIPIIVGVRKQPFAAVIGRTKTTLRFTGFHDWAPGGFTKHLEVVLIPMKGALVSVFFLGRWPFHVVLHICMLSVNWFCSERNFLQFYEVLIALHYILCQSILKYLGLSYWVN